MPGTQISKHPVHLGLGASATIEPEFTGPMDWYLVYAARHADHGKEARLVSMRTFTEFWDMREMHPHGSEIVLCIAGSISLHQETADGSATSSVLEAGQYAINESGTWHTTDIDGEATALFVTAGLGTQHRPR